MPARRWSSPRPAACAISPIAGWPPRSYAARDVPALAAAVGAVLADPAAARRAAARARRIVRRDYTWAAVAEQTAAVYERAGSKVR